MVSICRRDLLSYQILRCTRPVDLYTKTRESSSKSDGIVLPSENWRSQKTPDSPSGSKSNKSKDMSVEACIRRDAFSLMNKLTRENFHTVSKKFTQLSVTTPESIAEVSDIIFNKAVLEHSYSEIYADLILLLHQSYPDFPSKEGRSRITFASTLLNKCQREFAEIPPTLQEKDIKARPSQNSGRSATSKEGIANVISSMKIRLSGLMKFIAHLYLRDMLSGKVIREVGLHLVFRVEIPEEHYLECFCVLLKNIGSTLDSSAMGSDYMNTFDSRLRELHNSQQYSSRMRFIISDLRELRRNKWVDTRSAIQVQTKGAIRNQMEAQAGGEQRGCVFTEKVAGARPAYIQQQIEKVAADRVFNDKKLNQLADYFCQDASKEAAISDWIGLDLDKPDYEKAVAALLKRGYLYPKKADNILELMKVLAEYISSEILGQALQLAKPDYEDALIDNPNADQFQRNVVAYKDTLPGGDFERVSKKKKRKNKRSSRPSR